MSTIDASPPGGSGMASRSIASTLLLCFLIVTLDGFDTISITFVAPILAKAWGMSPAAMVPAFVATNLGAVIGYMASGPLALRTGTRSVMLGSVLLFGLGSLVTALASDITSLSILRFITALGLGGALPIAISRATEMVSPRRGSMVAMAIATGLSAGGLLAGLTGMPLMAQFGWTSIFIVGGILPLLLLPWIFVCFRETQAKPVQALAEKQSSPLRALFGAGLASRTIMLWLFAFLVFVNAYALISWLPTLGLQMGLPPEKAPTVAAVFSLGGILGDVLLIILAARNQTARTLMVAVAITLISIAAFSLIVPLPVGAILPIVLGLGMGLIPCCVGQAALAVSIYPARLRATGIGWAAALGRIGSIVGPGLGGMVLAFGWAPQQIVLAAGLPSLVALVLLIWFMRRPEVTAAAPDTNPA